MSGPVFSSGVRPAHPITEKEPPLMDPLTDPDGRVVDHGSAPAEAIEVDVDLLESQFRIARMMSYGPLTDEPGA